MGAKCCACNKELVRGETVVTFYFEQLRIGEKSGLPGLYPHPDYPDDSVDHVHFFHSCLEKCFSPVDNPFMYDSVVMGVRKEIESDIRDEIYEEFSAHYDNGDAPQLINLEEDPPICIFCKSTSNVWCHFRMGGTIYNCMSCRKLWDDEEIPLIWDPQNGYVSEFEVT